MRMDGLDLEGEKCLIKLKQAMQCSVLTSNQCPTSSVLLIHHLLSLEHLAKSAQLTAACLVSEEKF